MPDSVAIPQPSTAAASRGGPHTASLRAAAELLDAVKELTQRHFPEGPVDVEVESDPEVPSDEFFVFSVTASGSAEDIAQRHRHWRRDLHQLVANQFDAFRLSICLDRGL